MRALWKAGTFGRPPFAMRLLQMMPYFSRSNQLVKTTASVFLFRIELRCRWLITVIGLPIHNKKRNPNYTIFTYIFVAKHLWWHISSGHWKHFAAILPGKLSHEKPVPGICFAFRERLLYEWGWNVNAGIRRFVDGKYLWFYTHISPSTIHLRRTHHSFDQIKYLSLSNVLSEHYKTRIHA